MQTTTAFPQSFLNYHIIGAKPKGDVIDTEDKCDAPYNTNITSFFADLNKFKLFLTFESTFWKLEQECRDPAKSTFSNEYAAHCTPTMMSFLLAHINNGNDYFTMLPRLQFSFVSLCRSSKPKFYHSKSSNTGNTNGYYYYYCFDNMNLLASALFQQSSAKVIDMLIDYYTSTTPATSEPLLFDLALIQVPKTQQLSNNSISVNKVLTNSNTLVNYVHLLCLNESLKDLNKKDALLEKLLRSNLSISSASSANSWYTPFEIYQNYSAVHAKVVMTEALKKILTYCNSHSQKNIKSCYFSYITIVISF